jgi:hypothetical protein
MVDTLSEQASISIWQARWHPVQAIIETTIGASYRMLPEGLLGVIAEIKSPCDFRGLD